MAESIATALQRLFVNRKDAYAKQTIDGHYISEKQPLTFDTLQRHLKGEMNE